MFPIPFNFPFRKKDGSIISLSKAIEDGGSYTLPTASADTKGGVKVGAGLTMDGETLKNSNPTPYTLPTASADTKGGVKIGDGLEIDGEVLKTTGGGGSKLYYKEFTSVTWSSSEKLAKFDNGSALESSYGIAYCDNLDITISDYTPISAVAIDAFTGYRYTLGIERTRFYNQPVYRLGPCIGNRSVITGGANVIVYYVKNTDLEQLT